MQIGIFPTDNVIRTFLVSARKVPKEADLRRRYVQMRPP